MSKIDPKTGLPKIDDGLYWEVYKGEEKNYTEYGSYTTPCHYISLMKDNTNCFVTTRKRRLFGGYKTVTKPVKSPEFLFTQKIRTGGSGYINAQGTLNAALVILDRKEAQENAAKLVGKFPPNKVTT